MKENIEKALELNPNDGASWHVLGMWHTGVANLNFVMKAALKALFGGMPEASHEKAIECFLKADAAKPNLSTTVELAKVYKRLRSQGKQLQLVFVSSDKDAAAFEEYRAHMPFPAIPYESGLLRAKLGQTFQVRLQPTPRGMACGLTHPATAPAEHAVLSAPC